MKYAVQCTLEDGNKRLIAIGSSDSRLKYTASLSKALKFDSLEEVKQHGFWLPRLFRTELVEAGTASV